MNKTIALLLLLVPVLACAEEMYRWRDANGVWHFSDKPHPGAEKIEVRPAPAVPMAPAPSRSAAPRRAENARAAEEAPRLTILAPAQEATIRDAEGQVDVAVEVSPGLRAGYQVRILLDGNVVAGPGALTQVQLTGLDRGAHTVAAELVGANGEVLARAEPHTFYIHKPSLLSPANRPQPPPKPAPKPKPGS